MSISCDNNVTINSNKNEEIKNVITFIVIITIIYINGNLIS